MAWSAWQPDNNKGGGTPVRWIFYSLLVVNLVYLGVQLTKNLGSREQAVSLLADYLPVDRRALAPALSPASRSRTAFGKYATSEIRVP